MPSRVKGGRKLREFLRKARAAESRSKRVDVGFFAEARYPDGEELPVAQVAAFHEFGTKAIAERPFMRGAVSGAEREIIPVARAGINPKTMELDERTAAQIGEVMKSRIRRGIAEDPPLVDTKRLYKSVDAKVRDAGER